MAIGPYRRRFDLDAWRKRFKETLAARFVLRFHMTLILLLVIAGGLVTTRLLFALGVTSMGLRYFAAVCTGYGAFFLLVRAWLGYLTDAVHKEAPHVQQSDVDLVHAIAPDEAADVPVPAPMGGAVIGGTGGNRRRQASSGSGSNVDVTDVGIEFGSTGGSSGGSSSGSSGGSSGGGFSLDLDVGDGAAAVIIIVVVALVALAIFGAAGYFVWEAPAILGEAAVEVVLASALVRASRRIDRPGWSGSVLRATWIPAVIVVVLATTGGLIAQGLCPGESTLPGVIKQCVQQDKPPAG